MINDTISRHILKSNVIYQSLTNDGKQLTISDRDSFREYIRNIKIHKNIIIDAANVYLSGIEFPFHYLYVYVHDLYLIANPERRINLHFVNKNSYFFNDMIDDLAQIKENLNPDGSSNVFYEKRKGKVERKFYNLHGIVSKFNFYFYCIDIDNPMFVDGVNEDNRPIWNQNFKNIDDIYFLYLYSYLHGYNQDILISTSDLMMVRHHILNKSYLNYEPFMVGLFTYSGEKLVKVCDENVSLKKKKYLFNYYYERWLNDGIRTADLKRTENFYASYYPDHIVCDIKNRFFKENVAKRITREFRREGEFYKKMMQEFESYRPVFVIRGHDEKKEEKESPPQKNNIFDYLDSE